MQQSGEKNILLNDIGDFFFFRKKLCTLGKFLDHLLQSRTD